MFYGVLRITSQLCVAIEYRRRGSNPHMELPIPDFESGASAIPPLRRYLNCLRVMPQRAETNQWSFCSQGAGLWRRHGIRTWEHKIGTNCGMGRQEFWISCTEKGRRRTVGKLDTYSMVREEQLRTTVLQWWSFDEERCIRYGVECCGKGMRTPGESTAL